MRSWLRRDDLSIPRISVSLSLLRTIAHSSLWTVEAKGWVISFHPSGWGILLSDYNRIINSPVFCSTIIEITSNEHPKILHQSIINKRYSYGLTFSLVYKTAIIYQPAKSIAYLEIQSYLVPTLSTTRNKIPEVVQFTTCIYYIFTFTHKYQLVLYSYVQINTNLV